MTTVSEIGVALLNFAETVNERLDDFELRQNRPPAPGGTGDGFNSRGLVAERRALAAFARTGDESALRQNSMSIGDDTAGGYATFPAISPQIAKRLYDTSPMRRICRVVTLTSGDRFEEPVEVGETGATWAGEAQSRTATDSPTLGLLRIPVNEIFALVPITQRALDDSGYDLGAWIEERIGDKFGRTEGSAAIVGDGIQKPQGLLTYPTSVSADFVRAPNTLQRVNSGGATTVTADGLRNLFWSVRAAYRANGTWLMSSATANAIDRLKDGSGEYLWRAGLAAGAPNMLLGKPVEFCEDFPAIGASSYPIAFGDFRTGYCLVDKLGIRLLRDPFSQKPNVLFYAYRRVGGSVANFDAIKLLFVSA